MTEQTKEYLASNDLDTAGIGFELLKNDEYMTKEKKELVLRIYNFDQLPLSEGWYKFKTKPFMLVVYGEL